MFQDEFKDRFKDMSIPEAVEALRGLKYVEKARVPDENGADCVGLASILVPELANHVRESDLFIKNIAKSINNLSYGNAGKISSSMFVHIKDPKNMCLVTMSKNPNTSNTKTHRGCRKPQTP